jgi:hypothetical protein
MMDSVVGRVTTPKLRPTQLSIQGTVHVKQPGYEAEHPQSCPEVKNEWSYTLTPHNTSMVFTMTISSVNLSLTRAIGLLRQRLKWAIGFGIPVAVNKNSPI